MSNFSSFLAWPLALPILGREGLGMPTFTSIAQQWEVLHDLEADTVLDLDQLVPGIAPQLVSGGRSVRPHPPSSLCL